MLVLTILVFALLFGIARFFGHNLLFPPELLNGTWLLSLIAVLLSRDSLYPIEASALAVYVVGAAAFSVGGVAALSFTPASPDQHSSPVPSVAARLALDLALVGLAVGLPFFWGALSESVADVESSVIMNALRSAQLERAEEATTFAPVLNLAVLAQFTAVAMFWETDGSWRRRWRAGAAIALALVYGAMGGTKGNAVVLILTLFFTSSIQERRIRVGSLVLSTALALLLFSLGLLAVNFAFDSFAGTGEAFRQLAATIQMYWLGGLVAFGAVAMNPGALASTQPVHRFFLETARSLGVAVEVPSLHAEFTSVAPYTETNVYTIYFSYFKDHGWLGTVAIMFCLGAALTALYRAAMRGHTVAALLLARMCVGVVLTIQAEHFLLELNALVKLVAFLVFLYGLLPALERRAPPVASRA